MVDEANNSRRRLKDMNVWGGLQQVLGRIAAGVRSKHMFCQITRGFIVVLEISSMTVITFVINNCQLLPYYY